MTVHVVLHSQVRVAVIREEGSNGDREMSAAVYAAGMEPWDITMSDLINGRAQLDSFRGIIFVGESMRPGFL
jgi:phosphoribosylformylglycinamidine synthase